MYEHLINTWQSAERPGFWTDPLQAMETLGSTAMQQSLAWQRQWAEQCAGLFQVSDADTAQRATLQLLENTSKLYLASVESQIRLWSALTSFWPLADCTETPPARKRTPAAEMADTRPETKLEVVGNTPVAAASDDASDLPNLSARDDLKQISGIGPGLESKLNQEGIFNFRQIAEFTAKDIARLEQTVIKFPGRIERDGWVAQAKKLLAGQ